MDTAPTPGYNRRIEYKLSTDKNGRKRATRFSNHRWLPAKREEAEFFIAQGLADLHPTHSDRPCLWCKETWKH